MTTPAPSTPYASASLYVGDLVADVTEAMLYETFNAVGPVASVRVCRDAATRRSLGYAYVNFHRVDDADRALDTMNFKDIRDQPCRIMWSHRDPSLRKSGLGNIFVKGLAKTIDNKQLYDTFSMFGNILSCKVATDLEGKSLSYGFVHYESAEAAADAIKMVTGKAIAGEIVVVSQFKSKKERGGGPNKHNFTNIYVKNFPDDWDKAKLEEVFARFGKISSCAIAFDAKGVSKGFGFVAFESSEEAAPAVQAMHNAEFGEQKLYVVRAQKKAERMKELRERFEQLKMERQKKYAGVNLYVKNLSDDLDDDKLLKEFSQFGSITSAHVMRDSQTKKSKGFGFVCFSTPEEATKCVTEMNGRMLDQKPLYVALAQRKEVRRQQLELQHAQRAKLGVHPQPMYPQQTPMFYQNMPQRNFYPQQMVARPWGANQPMMRHPGMQYQLMPMNQRGAANGQGGQGGAGRGRGRNPRQGGAPKQGQPGPQGQPQNFKYTEGARNRDQRQAQQPAAQAQIEPQMAAQNQGSLPLTIKELAAAPEDQKKRMIGERLFPLIHEQQPELAGKITGMLLEMDNTELLILLDDGDALTRKIDEALAVLNDHSTKAQEEAPAQE